MRTQIPGKQILDEGIDTEDLNESAVTDEKLSDTGVQDGSYTKVTVNQKGRVVLGENPTTLAGLGITDGASSSASFLTVIPEAGLPGSRRLGVVPDEIRLIDNGQGSNLQVGLADNPIFPGTGSITLSSGTTAQRPLTPVNGMLRYNTTLTAIETPVGAVWQKLVLDSDYRLQGDANVLQVRVVPKPGQFGSIAEACASLVGVATEESQWLVDVGPGDYVEPEITVPAYVHVSGFTEYAIYVQPDSNNHPVFKMEEFSTVSFLNVENVTGANQYAFELYDTGDYGVLLHKVCLSANTNGFDIKAITRNSVVYLEYCDTEQNTGIGVNIDSESAEFSAYANLENFYVYGSNTNPTIGVNAVGPNVYINIQSFGMEGIDGTGEAFNLANAARIDVKAGSIFGWDVGTHLENVGAPSICNFVGVDFHDNTTWDLLAEHPGSLGTLGGTADRHKVNAVSAPGFTFAFADSNNNEYIQTGNFYLGATAATITNVTGLLIETPPMGLLTGGTLAGTGGLGIQVSAGSGYLRKDGSVTFMTWPTTSLSVTPGQSPYIYLNKNGVFQQGATEPDGSTNILFGRVGANATQVYSLGPLSTNITSYGNKIENYLRKAVGPVYVSGSIITENATTPRAIDVTAGTWFYGTQTRNPSAKTAPTIQDIHRGGGTIQIDPVATVPNSTYDNGTQLVSVTAGYFTKHALYSVSEGLYQTFSLGHSQAQYATLEEALEAPFPTPLIPPDATPLIGGFIMQEGTNSIVRIIDMRPMFFRTGGISNSGTGGVVDHGDLLGLSDDDHQQYLLVDGTRAMGGDLNMSGFDLDNVLSINDVVIETHASRHQPNGQDPIPTGPGVNVSTTSVNGTGTSNLLARADHTHALIGVQPSSTELTQVAALSSTGIVIRSAANTWTTRSLTSATGTINLTSADGVAGNPSIDLKTIGTSGTYYSVTTDAYGRVVVGGTTVPWSAITTPPTTLSGYGITDAQPLNTNLTNLANATGTGFFIKTASGVVNRSLVAPAAGFTITNPDGVNGAPTFALANDLAQIEAFSTAGIAVRTGTTAGTETWAVRTLVQPTAGGFTITNPAGTAGNFTFVLAGDLLAVENLATVGIAVRSATTPTWTTRSLAITSPLTITNADGSAGNPTIGLGTVGTAGTYTQVTTDSFGRVTVGANPTTLAGYGITDAVNTNLLGANNGVATLDSTGKLTLTQVPSIAISDTFVVASQAAQLAVSGADVGDIAIRTDLNKSYILKATPASTFTNWQELLTPTDSVTSVNGQTGVVTLNYVTSVGATAPAAGFTISGSPITSTGTFVFALANDLLALENLSGTGFSVRTAADTWVQRTIGAGTGIAVANADGVAGSPVISLSTSGTAGTYTQVTTDIYGRVSSGANPTTLAGYGITDAQGLDSDLTALAQTTTTGLYTILATGSSITRSLAGGTGISITNANGVAGNPTVALATAGTAGTYGVVTTDAYGRVTSGSNPTTLAGHGITDAINISEKGAASGVATLGADGKLSAAQVPAIAVSDTFVVASQTEQTALTAEVGDIAIRTDVNRSYILRSSPASVFSNWQELLTPTDAVTSVNGQTGAVTTPQGTVTSVATTSPVSGLSISGGPITSSGTLIFSLANDLAALEALSGTGFSVRTGADAWSQRTIVSANAGLTITNGDGVGGNPTITLPTIGTAGTYKSVTTDVYGRVTAGTNPTTLGGFGITDAQPLDVDLTALANTSTTGIYTITGVGTSTTRTLTQGTGISITNGSGVAGNPTITLATVGTAGTYKSVTTDVYGRVTAGTNPTTLSGYGITDAVNTNQLGVNGGVATLDGTGRLTAAQIPSIAISDTFVVGSQAEQVALSTADVGDIAIRTDLNKSYILKTAPYSTFANWQELLTPTDSVTSVNGQTGAVVVPTGTVTSISATGPAAGITITGSPITSSGTLTFALANDLLALENLGGTGIAVRTAADAWAQRTITAGNAGLTVTNGDGVAGNPTITLPTTGTAGTYRSVTTDAYGRVTAGTNPTTLAGYGITDAQPLDSDLTALAANAGTGLYTITGVGTSTTRSIVAGSGISVSNGSGVAGNITITSTVSGTVTSVGLSLPSIFTVSGSPITSNGTLTGTLNTQAPNTVLAGPVSGAAAVPTFRTLGLGELNNVVLTTPTSNQTLTYNGANWVNSSVAGANATGTVGVTPTGGGTGWTLLSGTRYYADFVHNLGTSNVVITVYNNSTNAVVIPDEVVLQDSNTVRITVVGNTRTLKVVVIANGQSIAAGGSTPSSVITAYNGVTVTAAATKLNFIGSTVVADNGSGTTTVSIGARFTNYANSFDTPNNSDWALPAFAPVLVDPTYSSMNVRSFSNTVEQGVGFMVTIPGGATQVNFRIRGRPGTAPASASVVQFRVYFRSIPNGTAVGSWIGPLDLPNLAIPTNAFFQYYFQNSTLAAAGLTAGQTYQFEVTRKVAGLTGTNLPYPFYMAETTFEFV